MVRTTGVEFNFVYGPPDWTPRYTLYPATIDVLDVQLRSAECGTVCDPVPDNGIVAGELEALLTTARLPVTLPATAGVKVTFRVPPCPGAKICPADRPLALKPAPEMLTFEIVTWELPEFVSVTASVLLAPVFTFPNVRLAGVALSRKVAALTVSAAAVLVTLPTLLLTTTVNCAPLSDVVSAGVV